MPIMVDGKNRVTVEDYVKNVSRVCLKMIEKQGFNEEKITTYNKIILSDSQKRPAELLAKTLGKYSSMFAVNEIDMLDANAAQLIAVNSGMYSSEVSILQADKFFERMNRYLNDGTMDSREKNFFEACTRNLISMCNKIDAGEDVKDFAADDVILTESEIKNKLPAEEVPNNEENHKEIKEENHKEIKEESHIEEQVELPVNEENNVKNDEPEVKKAKEPANVINEQPQERFVPQYITNWDKNRKPNGEGEPGMLSKNDFVELMYGLFKDYNTIFGMESVQDKSNAEALFKEALGRYFYGFKNKFQIAISLDVKIRKDNEKIEEKNAVVEVGEKKPYSSREGTTEIYYDRHNERQVIDHIEDDLNVPRNSSIIPYDEFKRKLGGMYTNDGKITTLNKDFSEEFDFVKELFRSMSLLNVKASGNFNENNPEVKNFIDGLPEEPVEDNTATKNEIMNNLNVLSISFQGFTLSEQEEKNSIGKIKNKEYYEIKNEFKELSKYIEKLAKSNTIEIKDMAYIDIMRKALKQKAEMYVASEMPVAKNRNDVTYMQFIEGCMTGHYFSSMHIENYHLNPSFDALKKKMSDMTYNRVIFDAVTYEKDASKELVLDVMDEIYTGNKVTFKAAEAAYDQIDACMKKFEDAIKSPEFESPINWQINNYLEKAGTNEFGSAKATFKKAYAAYLTNDDKINMALVAKYRKIIDERNVSKANEFEKLNIFDSKYKEAVYTNSADQLGAMEQAISKDIKAEKKPEKKAELEAISKYITIKKNAANAVSRLERENNHEDAKIIDNGQGVVEFDIPEPEKQTTKNGCWSVSMGILLKSRGVELPQQYIRAFTPDLKPDDIKSIDNAKSEAQSVALAQKMNIEQELKAAEKAVKQADEELKSYKTIYKTVLETTEPSEDKVIAQSKVEADEEDLVIKQDNLKLIQTQYESVEAKETDFDILAGDHMGNVFEHSDLVMKTIPNTAMRNVIYDFTAGAEQKDIINDMEKTALEAFEKDKSPVSILMNGHYRTIVGIEKKEGEPVKFKLYNSATDGQTQTMTMNDIVNTNVSRIELTWLNKLSVEMNGHVNGIPEKFSGITYNKGKLDIGDGYYKDDNHFQKNSDAIMSVKDTDEMLADGNKQYRSERYVAPKKLVAPQAYLDRQDGSQRQTDGKIVAKRNQNEIKSNSQKREELAKELTNDKVYTDLLSAVVNSGTPISFNPAQPNSQMGKISIYLASHIVQKAQFESGDYKRLETECRELLDAKNDEDFKGSEELKKAAEAFFIKAEDYVRLSDRINTISPNANIIASKPKSLTDEEIKNELTKRGINAKPVVEESNEEPHEEKHEEKKTEEVSNEQKVSEHQDENLKDNSDINTNTINNINQKTEDNNENNNENNNEDEKEEKEENYDSSAEGLYKNTEEKQNEKQDEVDEDVADEQEEESENQEEADSQKESENEEETINQEEPEIDVTVSTELYKNRRMKPTDAENNNVSTKQANENMKNIAAELVSGYTFVRLIGLADRLGVQITSYPLEGAPEFEKQLAKFVAAYVRPENLNEGYAFLNDLRAQLGNLVKASKEYKLPDGKEIYGKMFGELMEDIDLALSDLKGNMEIYSEVVAIKNINDYVEFAKGYDSRRGIKGVVGAKTQEKLELFRLRQPVADGFKYLDITTPEGFEALKNNKRYYREALELEKNYVMETAPQEMKKFYPSGLESELKGYKNASNLYVKTEVQKPGRAALDDFNADTFMPNVDRIDLTVRFDPKLFYADVAKKFMHAHLEAVENALGTNPKDSLNEKLAPDYRPVSEGEQKKLDNYKDIIDLAREADKADKDGREELAGKLDDFLARVDVPRMEDKVHSRYLQYFAKNFRMRTNDVDAEKRADAKDLLRKMAVKEALMDGDSQLRWENVLLFKPGITEEEKNNIKKLIAEGKHKELAEIYKKELERTAATDQAKYGKISEYLKDFDNTYYVYCLHNDAENMFNNWFTVDQQEQNKIHVTKEELKKAKDTSNAISNRLNYIEYNAKLLANPVSDFIDVTMMSKYERDRFIDTYQGLTDNDDIMLNKFANDMFGREIAAANALTYEDSFAKLAPAEGKIDLKLGKPTQLPSEQAYSVIYDELGGLYPFGENYHGPALDKDFYMYDKYIEELRQLRGANDINVYKNEKAFGKIYTQYQKAYDHAVEGEKEARENGDEKRAELCGKLKAVLLMDKPILDAMVERAGDIRKKDYMDPARNGLFVDDLVMLAKEDVLEQNKEKLLSDEYHAQKRFINISRVNYDYVERVGKMDSLTDNLQDITDNAWREINIFASQMDVFVENMYIGGSDFYDLRKKLNAFVKDRPDTFDAFHDDIANITNLAQNCAYEISHKVTKGRKMTEAEIKAGLSADDYKVYKFANMLKHYAGTRTKEMTETTELMYGIDKDAATKIIIPENTQKIKEKHYTTSKASSIRKQLRSKIEKEGCIAPNFAMNFAKYMVLDELITNKRTETIKRLTDSELEGRAKYFLKSSGMTAMLAALDRDYDIDTLKWGYKFCKRRAVDLERLRGASPEALKKAKGVLEGELKKFPKNPDDKNIFANAINQSQIEWFNTEIDLKEQDRQNHIDEIAVRINDPLDDTIGSNAFFAQFKPDTAITGDVIYNINQQTIGTLVICHMLNNGKKLSDIEALPEDELENTKKICISMMKYERNKDIADTLDKGMEKLQKNALKIYNSHKGDIFDRKFIESAAGHEFELAVRTMKKAKNMMEMAGKNLVIFGDLCTKWSKVTEELYKPFKDTESALEEASSMVKSSVVASESHFFDHCLGEHTGLKTKNEFGKLIEDLNASPEKKAYIAKYALEGNLRELFDDEGESKVPTLDECVKFVEKKEAERETLEKAEKEKAKEKAKAALESDAEDEPEDGYDGEIKVLKDAGSKKLAAASVKAVRKINSYSRETDVPLFLENHNEMKNNIRVILHGVFISRCLTAGQKLPDAEQMFKKLLDTKTMKKAMYEAYLGATRAFIKSDKPVQILEKAMIEAGVVVADWNKEKTARNTAPQTVPQNSTQEHTETGYLRPQA